MNAVEDQADSLDSMAHCQIMQSEVIFLDQIHDKVQELASEPPKDAYLFTETPGNIDFLHPRKEQKQEQLKTALDQLRSQTLQSAALYNPQDSLTIDLSGGL